MADPDDRPPFPWRIQAQGDRCLEIRLGSGIDIEIGRQCARAAAALRGANLPGVTDIIPTFNAVAVHFRPPQHQGTTYAPDELAQQITDILNTLEHTPGAAVQARTVDIPVCYGGAYGPDLDDVAAHCGISPDEVIRLHSEPTAYVFMLGFAPGAPYIGVHDEKLAIGRRTTPRTRLPAGSVAIANRQTMIYPNASPGGWHIIGATPVVLFDPAREPATLLAPGDSVRFVPVAEQEYERLLGAKP